jgi:hypothetical protein
VKKRVFLDECCSDSNLASVFGPKAHVYTAKDLGVAKKKDPIVIDKAVKGLIRFPFGSPCVSGSQIANLRRGCRANERHHWP